MSMLMDRSCNICEGNDNQQKEFKYYDGLQFATHGMTEQRTNKKNKVSIGSRKRSIICKDKQADFSDDVGNVNLPQKLQHPSRKKRNSENFRGGRGQNRRGRGKGTEKTMQVETDNIGGNTSRGGRSGEFKRDEHRDDHHDRGSRGYRGSGRGRGGNRGRGHDDNKYENESSDGRCQEFNLGHSRGNNRGRGRGRSHENNKYGNESRGDRSREFNRGQGRGGNRGRGRGRGRGHEDNKDGDEIPDGRSREFSKDRHQDDNNDRGSQEYRGRGQGRGGNRGRGRGRHGRR